jgi:hypothetical protein
MRRSVAIAFAVLSFAFGTWVSARASSQAVEASIPVRAKPGERVTVMRPESVTCEVERVWNEWVQCKGGIWRNLNNGTAYQVERDTR